MRREQFPLVLSETGDKSNAEDGEADARYDLLRRKTPGTTDCQYTSALACDWR